MFHTPLIALNTVALLVLSFGLGVALGAVPIGLLWLLLLFGGAVAILPCAALVPHLNIVFRRRPTLTREWAEDPPVLITLALGLMLGLAILVRLFGLVRNSSGYEPVGLVVSCAALAGLPSVYRATRMLWPAFAGLSQSFCPCCGYRRAGAHTCPECGYTVTTLARWGDAWLIAVLPPPETGWALALSGPAAEQLRDPLPRTTVWNWDAEQRMLWLMAIPDEIRFFRELTFRGEPALVNLHYDEDQPQGMLVIERRADIDAAENPHWRPFDPDDLEMRPFDDILEHNKQAWERV